MSENEVEERKEEYRPPKFDIVSREVINENTPSLNLGEVVESQLGICFKFNDYMYLYKFKGMNGEIDSEKIKFNVELTDVRKYDEKILSINTDEFIMVKIVKTKERYYLSRLFDSVSGSIDKWLVNGLDWLFYRMYEHYLYDIKKEVFIDS